MQEADNIKNNKIPVLRGIRTYNELLLEEESTTLPKQKKGGRSVQKIENRNNFLFHRFYYYTKLQGKNYPNTLQDLANETWLTTTTVGEIIQDNSNKILLIKKAAPTIKQLKQLWQHIEW